MNSEKIAPKSWWLALLFYAGWLAIGYGLFFILPTSTLVQSWQPPVRHFILQFTFSLYMVGLLTPPVIFITKILSFEKLSWWQIIGGHLIGLIVFTAIYIHALQFSIEQFLGPLPRGFGARMRPPLLPRPDNVASGILQIRLFLNALQHIWQAVFYYLLILGVGYSISFYRKFREREIRASQLETQLINSQLQALKTQLQPHFLFNTLHTLSSLIYEDVPAADKMIRQLSDLLRLTLETTGDQEIPLKKEVEHLKLYLDIMQIRFQNRLQVEITVDENAKTTLIPTLLLQPLVENSIKHGLEATAGKGIVTISASRMAEDVIIVVEDNGPGFTGETDALLQKGVGLRNTKDRLSKLFGAAQKMDIISRENGGMRILIRFPYHAEPWMQNLRGEK
ncbi:MAG: histidine kinase [Deferribacteres bacterium]|nr:histidine kinase [Deferribacteres bacterium]